MKKAPLLLLFLPLFSMAQDSLFIASEKPVSVWEDNPATLGMEYQVSKSGTIKAVKYYKWQLSSKPDTLTIWDASGGIWFKQAWKPTVIGWQRIPCNLAASVGVKYIAGVYNNDTRYGFRTGVYPRVRGSLTGNAGKFGYPSAMPVNGGDCYYLDIVFKADAQPPVTASVTPNIAVYEYGIDSIKIIGKVENAASFQWEIVDSVGSSSVRGLTTLSPAIYPKDQEGCSVLLMLTATGIDGIQRSAMCDITVKPDPNEQVGIITRSGKILWLKQIIVTKPFNVGP